MTRMRNLIPAALFATVICTGCLIAPEPDEPVYAGPALPPVVEFETVPYYNYGGYHYYYHDNAWYWRHSRSGRWHALPREHYPRETRWRGDHERFERH